ncbi:hypothetical protein KJA15_03570 [Patescibacteria group bacterium]|nr:hypothetical protein [Patescibacteria group bacterium]
MNKNVKLPKYLRKQINPLRQPYPRKVKLLVFDTETYSQGLRANGEAFLLIFYDGEVISTFRVNKNIILNRFIGYLLKNCISKKHSYILMAHNLPFDLTAVFDKYREKLFMGTTSKFICNDKNHEFLAEIKFFTHKIWFAQIKLCNGINIKVVDSIAFIQGSLYNLSRILRFKYKKREKPSFLGRKPKNSKEWRELYRYCYDEIKAEYELAQWILNMLKKYDTTFCVSIAQLSSKIFRKHFLKTPIPQIPEHIRKLAEYTIHGGRASVFVETTPTLIFNVKMYDYNSFYSYSMATLPAITRGEWRKVENFDNEHEGFYRIWGYVKPCKYPIIIKSTSSLIFANNEPVSNVPITSYELKEALRNHEIRLDKTEGYVWIPDEGSVNPFRDYVNHFFKEKNRYKNTNPLYIQAKLLLNSLYGKCYQTLLDEESQNEADFYINFKKTVLVQIQKTWKAGGLYLPHVGSWITSQCRALLHKSLHDYNAIDCSTDSFKTTMNLPTSQELGGFKKECEGMLLLLRPKLYVMFSLEKQREFLGSNLTFRVWLKKVLGSLEIGKDKDIIKVATHGFWGKITRLLEMVASDEYYYNVIRMRKIREAIRQKKNPRVMFKQKRSLIMDWHKLDSPLEIAEEWGKLNAI